MDATDLCYTSAIDLGRMIRSRELSPVELTDAVLARIERLNPKLNAFLTVTADLAREQARASEARALRNDLIGPLDGIPYSLKDLEPTAGIRTTFGSRWFVDNVPTEDGTIAARLKPTGAVLLGKTNTPNFGYKDMCDNMIGPPCSNPWRLDRTSGASSGGAGSAVAAGLGPIAHGSDGAGSIRIPSALCGIFGLKPSFGRVPYAPTADLFAARSHNGPMTRTVRDAAHPAPGDGRPGPARPALDRRAAGDYLAACDGDLRGLRVAWSPDLVHGAVDPEVRAAAEAAARRFTDFGATLEDGGAGLAQPARLSQDDLRGERRRAPDRALRRAPGLDRGHPGADDPERPWRLGAGAQQGAAGPHRPLRARLPLLRDLRPAPDAADAGRRLVQRARPEEGPREIGGRPTPTMFDRLPFTYPFNLTGQPAATVPCGFTSEGLPIGLQIVGRWHAETTVFRAAACFEAAQPWVQARPPLD